MDIYIQEPGTALKKEKEHFVICTDEKKTPIATDMVESFIISEKISITTDFIKLAIENDIPIYFQNGLGNIYGKIWKSTYSKSSILHKKQLKVFSSKYGNLIARKWIIEKIETQKRHIIKLHKRKNLNFSNVEISFEEIIKKIRSIDLESPNFSTIIMGYEGNSSRIYYSYISNFLPETWGFQKRVQQGATDYYNIVLNYLFGVLYSKVEHSLIVAGLDVQTGILHSDIVNQKSLLFDFIEPYRFIVWETAFGIFSKKIINKNHFSVEDKRLTIDGKKIILNEFYKKINNTITINEKNYKFEQLITKNAKHLAKELLENEVYNQL